MNYFSDLEGLRIAMNIEKRGADFYRQAQETAVDPEHKLLFGYLLQEEINHAAKFESMYNSLKQTKHAGDEDYLFDENVSRYLQVLVETQVFPHDNPFAAEPQIANGVLETGWKTQIPGQSKPDQWTAGSILCLALQAEKDSIMFYNEMMKNARFPEAKELFSELKTEEQTHLEKLQELIRHYN